MIRENQMVRDGGPPMKVAVINSDGVAECVFYDSNGIPRLRFVPVERLQTMRQALQPRSLWPEVNQFDQYAIEQEEKRAAEARRLERRAARKAKRSNKIKRRVPA